MPVRSDGRRLAETPEIDGHRVGVIHVVELVLYGPWSVEDVAGEVYPQLTEAEVLDALEYALSEREHLQEALTHRAQVKAQLADYAISGSGEIPPGLRNH